MLPIKRSPRSALFALLVGLLPPLAAADIYKCTNAEGAIEFRNMPCKSGNQQEVLPEKQPPIVGWGSDGQLRPVEPKSQAAAAETEHASTDNTGEAMIAQAHAIKAWLQAFPAQFREHGLRWAFWLVLVVYFVMSVVSFLTYRRDKREYQVEFWLIVGAHVLAWAGVGYWLLQSSH